MAGKVNVADFFFECADRHPERPAIIDRDGSVITFGEMAKQVRETANYYRSKGIGRGDRVLVFVPMGIQLYRGVMALFHIGATAVFLDEWVSRERLELCCKIADSKAFIGIFKARLLAFFVSKELRKVPIKLGGAYKTTAQRFPIDACTADDTALITFTTGSTGTPKAAKRTHGFLKAQFDALVDKIQPQDDDVDMPVLPIVLLLNLGTGVPSVIAGFKASKPDSLDPGKIIAHIKAHGVNRLTASPFFIRRLSEYVLQRKISLPQLRRMFTGGAPVFPDEAVLYRKAFPDCNTTIVYGSTEAEPISSITSNELAEKHLDLHSGLDVGLPYRLTRVKIIPMSEEPLQFETEAALDAFALKQGLTGEILVSGPHVLSAYFNNEEALKRNKIFINGEVWHRTGDAGFIDEQGHLRLCGRCSTMITNADGNYIAPFLYENYFQSIEGVAAGTVLELNKKITAIVELRDASKENAVRTRLEKEQHHFDVIRFIPKIPRDPRHHSKVDYGKLREIL